MPSKHVIAGVNDQVQLMQGETVGICDSIEPETDRKTVLVLDADPEIAELEQLILQEAGFKVLKSRNGLEGYQIAQKAALSALVLDSDLPGMDGFEVCLRLRANPSTSSLPIIFLAGTLRSPRKAIAAGADRVLFKPEGISELAAAVADLLRH